MALLIATLVHVNLDYRSSLGFSTCLNGSQLSCQCTECDLGKSINSTLGLGVGSARGGGGWRLVGGGGKNRGTFLTSLQLAFKGLDRNPSTYSFTSVNSDAISS